MFPLLQCYYMDTNIQVHGNKTIWTTSSLLDFQDRHKSQQMALYTAKSVIQTVATVAGNQTVW